MAEQVLLIRFHYKQKGVARGVPIKLSLAARTRYSKIKHISGYQLDLSFPPLAISLLVC